MSSVNVFVWGRRRVRLGGGRREEAFEEREVFALVARRTLEALFNIEVTKSRRPLIYLFSRHRTNKKYPSKTEFYKKRLPKQTNSFVFIKTTFLENREIRQIYQNGEHLFIDIVFNAKSEL